MEGFTKTAKMQCFKEGGSVQKQVSNFTKRDRKMVDPDIAQDKALVKKGVKQHEAALHEGEPKTELKLKTGGRAKKEKGTVKKYADGGSIQGTVSDAARKLKENIIGTPEQNKVGQAALDKQAAAGSKLAKVLGGQGAVSDAERATASKFKKGGCAKK